MIYDNVGKGVRRMVLSLSESKIRKKWKKETKKKKKKKRDETIMRDVFFIL